MWIKDRSGHPINMDKMLSLYVADDPGNSGYYVVRGNMYDPGNAEGALAASFSTNGWSTMTQVQAGTLLDTLAGLLGAFDPLAL